MVIPSRVTWSSYAFIKYADIFNVTISGQYNTAADMSLADYFYQCPILFTDLTGT